eukprot:scaffold1344_cov102-Cylindrotheca_fusiformis.AAC.3
MPEDESVGSFSGVNLKEIWTMLSNQGYCPRRNEACVSDGRLSLGLKQEQERKINDSAVLTVALISIEGHSAVIYSPTLDLDHPNQFLLRTRVG